MNKKRKVIIISIVVVLVAIALLLVLKNKTDKTDKTSKTDKVNFKLTCATYCDGGEHVVKESKDYCVCPDGYEILIYDPEEN